MGLDATLTVIPRSDVRKKRATSSKLPKFELYREWNELHSALQTMDSPANRAVCGNCAVSDDEEEAECDDGVIHVLIAPATVKRIKRALDQVSDERLLTVIHENRKQIGWRLRKYEHKHIISAFNTLKEAYKLAAKTDAYVEILIC